jgi:hypothetical protein
MLFAEVIIHLANETLSIMMGAPADSVLDCFYRAYLMSKQEQIHDLVRHSLELPGPPFAVAVDRSMRAAIDAVAIGEEATRLGRLRRRGEQYTDPQTELDFRRRYCELCSLAPGYFELASRRLELYQLADLEELLGLFDAAAASTERAAALEEDPESERLGRMIAAERRARGQRR